MNTQLLPEPGWLPLIVGEPDRVLAVRRDGPVTVGEFMVLARNLARRLPEAPHVVNLCEGRFRFALGLVAAMLRGQITLLPSNRAPKALEQIADLYPGGYSLADDFFSSAEGDPESPPITCDDAVAADRTIAIVFTSGSTGEPQPHPKTWGIFSESARLIANSLGIAKLSDEALIATVPAQHMYGLELSVLLPLCHGGRLVDAKPFFPGDIANQIDATAPPRRLITTPVHLRSCAESEIPFPTIEGIVSATAPLAGELATRAEALFNCELREIYGCSEAGSLAWRRTVEADCWQWFPGVRFGAGVVHTHYLPQSVPIQDLVEPLEGGRFRLLGRISDLVNVAGKRTSLGALNHALLDIEGVNDGVFFLLDDPQARLRAVAVAPSLTRENILRELQARIDPVFLPRPLYLVDRLPRSDSGKLTRVALQQLIDQAEGQP